MAVIDKISLFNGQAWSDPYYIGAEAENVRYNNTSNVKTALENINLVTNVINASAIPSGKNYLTYVNNDGKIAPSNVHKDTVVQKNSAGIIIAPITSATIESILTKSVTVNSTAGSATLHLKNNIQEILIPLFYINYFQYYLIFFLYYYHYIFSHF